MRTLIAVIVGLLVTGVSILCGDWVIGVLTGTTIVPGYAGASSVVRLASFLWVALSVAAGALVTVRIAPKREALAGFILGELFFGAGLLHEFWHVHTWFNLLALLIVIPSAMLGSRLGGGKSNALNAG